MNSVLGKLAQSDAVSLELLVSQQWLEDGKLDSRCPLSTLPVNTFPSAENATERGWKLFGFPNMDRYIPDVTDWLYAPMETYIPVSKCPVAVTIHDIQAFEPNLSWSNTWHHRLFRYKWGRWVRRALRDCRVVFTVSEFSKQRMVSLLGADPNKLVVVGNGVEQAFFDIASADANILVRPVDNPYSLIIGGLRQKKGADAVLAVAAELRSQQSPLQILVAGDSEPQYIEAAAQNPNVKLLGMVADADLPRILRCASSLLFLSLYEGFGIPALEAMAAGVPAVVSNRASLPEIVGDAGLIVDPEQTEQIADTLIALANDRQLRQDYIQRGHDHAAQYTWSACADRVLDAFHTFA